MEKEPTVKKNWAPIDSTKLLKSTGKHQKLNTSKYYSFKMKKKISF